MNTKTIPNMVPDMGFLKDNFIIRANKILKLPEEAVSAFIEAYKIIRNNQSLCKLLWNNHLILLAVK